MQVLKRTLLPVMPTVRTYRGTPTQSQERSPGKNTNAYPQIDDRDDIKLHNYLRHLANHGLIVVVPA